MKLLSAIMAAASIVATPAFAAEPDTITIGFTASRTGPLNVDSTGQERGYEFWRDEVNAKGGIKVGDKHYQVKFVSYDDQSVGGRVQQLYTRLITRTARNSCSVRIRRAWWRRRRSFPSSTARS
jgi:branched-chain amino acid transport system substrate-binding protein